MKKVQKSVHDLHIAYIGGGSRGWARGLMSDLAAEKTLSGTVKLYDIDRDAAFDNEKIGNALMARPDVSSEWRFKAVETLEQALTGTDFVVISILPGTFDEMGSDVHAPEKYGIYQSVGDTVGPGGVIRALRTIPMYIKIAESIQAFCPDAWVINYTNPMTICVRTLYKVFPKIKAFGCCHEVFGTEKLLGKMLADLKGIENVRRSDINVNVMGINHFTWIDSAVYGDIDLMPLFATFADKYYESGFEGSEAGHWMNDSFVSAERVKFDLFKRYGILAAAGDRHLAEFCPGYWYLKDPQTVRSWKFNLTPVSWRKADLKKRLEHSQRLLSGQEQFTLSETGEDGVKQMKALLGLQDLITNVNIPNAGQIQDVPSGPVVETNALFTKDSVRPIFAGKLPPSVQALVSRQIFNQETVLSAGMKKDYDLAFSAFANDPLVAISLHDAKALFDEMVENTKAYL